MLEFKNPRAYRYSERKEPKTKFDKKLADMGVEVFGSGLGPVYTYQGYTVASGIDEPTTIVKHWTLIKREKRKKKFPTIGSYRKKYVRTVEMVDGRPVKKFTKEVYKEYDEDKNPEEFLADLQVAVNTLKSLLPELKLREKQCYKHWLSTLSDVELVPMRDRSKWQPAGDNYLENGTLCRMADIDQHNWFVTTFGVGGMMKDLYMITDSLGCPMIKTSYTGETAQRLVNCMSTVYQVALTVYNKYSDLVPKKAEQPNYYTMFDE